jgi:hypothetical protein
MIRKASLNKPTYLLIALWCLLFPLGEGITVTQLFCLRVCLPPKPPRWTQQTGEVDALYNYELYPTHPQPFSCIHSRGFSDRMSLMFSGPEFCFIDYHSASRTQIYVNSSVQKQNTSQFQMTSWKTVCLANSYGADTGREHITKTRWRVFGVTTMYWSNNERYG